MRRKFVLLLCFAVATTGCSLIRIQSRNSAAQAPGSGFFKTIDRGTTWVLKNNLYTADGSLQRMPPMAVKSAKLDPQDPSTVYLATTAGLFYSHTRGDGWFHTLRTDGVVNDIAIDPQDKCTLYAAVHNKVLKSIDCARSWQLVHFSSLQGEFFTAIEVSRADSATIYLGSSKGALIWSRNSGRSWEVVRFFDNTSITKILTNPHDPGVFYVVTPSYGIQRTENEGRTWKALEELPVHGPDGAPKLSGDKPQPLKSLSGTATFLDLKFDGSQEEGLLYASGYGIFRLVDLQYWQEIEILNKPQAQKVYVVAVNEANANDIFFATVSAFYQSVNGGKDWTVKQAPSNGLPVALVLAPDNSQELYLLFNAPPR